MNRKTKTVWNLIFKKPGAALSAVVFLLISAVLNVVEVLVLERFIENFSAFHWKHSLCFAVFLSGIYAFYYIQTPFSDYLNHKITLQLRSYLERTVIEKTARISVNVLENKENQALLARLQDNPEKRYANGFFSILQIFGGGLGTAKKSAFRQEIWRDRDIRRPVAKAGAGKKLLQAEAGGFS